MRRGPRVRHKDAMNQLNVSLQHSILTLAGHGWSARRIARELNLNREFPGDPRGNYTQQLAHALAAEYFDKIEANIDLHSGTDRPTVDYVYIWSDEGLARAFGSKVLYRPTTGKTGTVYAGTTKTVTIDKRPEMKVTTIELGGGIVDQGPYVKRTVDGMLNQLRYLGAIEGDVKAPP